MLLVVATNFVAEGQHAQMIFWDPCFSISLCKEYEGNFSFRDMTFIGSLMISLYCPVN